MGDDLRLAMRALRRAPAFSATVIATLALGIAASVAVFSVADVVLVRRLPIRDQNRVVTLWATAPGAATEVPTALDRYARFRAATTTLTGVAGIAHYGSQLVPVQDGDATLHAREAIVTGNFFDVLGTVPRHGRLLRLDDDATGATPVIVISERYWRSAFGGDPAVVGRHVRLLNREMTATVIGVAPTGLAYPSGADFWIPIAPTRYPAVDLVARLRPAATPDAARAEFATFIDNDARAFPASLGARSLTANGAVVHPLPDVMIGPARDALIVLVVAVASLLLIGCVNVSNLVLVRATERTREMAVRRALGASSWRIASQLAGELGLLALAGAMLGVALAAVLLRVLAVSAPAGLPRVDEVALSPTAVTIAVVATMISLLLSGVLPAVLSGRVPIAALRADGRVGQESHRRRSMRSLMIAAQIALSLVLLTGAGLLIRSLLSLERVTLGYDADHLSIVQVTAPFRKYRTAQEFNDAFDAARRQMHAVPGVSAITPTLAWPFLGSNVFAARFDVRDRPDLNTADAPYVSWDAVGPEFSEAMRSPVIRGRGISSADRASAAPVAVVTTDLARLFWPEQDPLGKQLRFAGRTGDTTWRTVVGVIRPLHYRTLSDPTPTVLFSYLQEFQQGIFAVRSSRALSAMLPELRRAAAASDAEIVLWRAESMDDVMAGPLSRPRLEAFLVTAFATLALFLASVGLYGVVAFLVRAQTRELGIRIALGASRVHVIGLALRSAIRVAAIGILAGAALSVFGIRFVASELFGVGPADPVALAGSCVTLLATVAVASYIPARRAARIDPVRALQSDA
jgi:predicted permease